MGNFCLEQEIKLSVAEPGPGPGQRGDGGTRVHHSGVPGEVSARSLINPDAGVQAGGRR